MKRHAAFVLILALNACGGGPPVPDWKTDSANYLERYEKAYLQGKTSVADQYFRQALDASAGTGKIDRTARIWLIQCALHKAGRTPDTCEQYRTLAKIDSTPEDQAYFRFLQGDWTQLDESRLPTQYASVVKAAGTRDSAKIRETLKTMSSPLSRLIAISVLLERKQVDDTMLSLAAQTASDQGWRRPLLVYLELMASRARDRGDTQAVERLATQIKLVEQALGQSK